MLKNIDLRETQTPPSFAIAGKILTLDVGMAAKIDAGLDEVRAYVARIERGKRLKFDVRQEGDGVIVERLAGPGARGSGLQATLSAMAVGDRLELDGVRLSSLRATASMLGKRTGDHFAVTSVSSTKAVVVRSAQQVGGSRKYAFHDMAPGMKFTVARENHSGIDSLRTLCNRYGTQMAMKFVARENIDGSITVRCYADGGMPPKWAIDREHADLQQSISEAAGETGETY